MKKRSEVEICGELYVIKSDLQPVVIQKIAEYVDKKMRQIKESTPVISTSKTAILAALNIAEELFQLQLQKEEMEGDVAQRHYELIKLLDESLGQ